MPGLLCQLFRDKNIREQACSGLQPRGGGPAPMGAGHRAAAGAGVWSAGLGDAWPGAASSVITSMPTSGFRLSPGLHPQPLSHPNKESSKMHRCPLNWPSLAKWLLCGFKHCLAQLSGVVWWFVLHLCVTWPGSSVTDFPWVPCNPVTSSCFTQHPWYRILTALHPPLTLNSSLPHAKEN